MLNDLQDFRQPIAVDAAPAGRVCEWCGKPAEFQITALGGRRHNESGFFCELCNEAFARMVASALYREVREEALATQ